ncbi:MAG TPA: O-acetyl-ADP-ribose deacetylase [Candidatus Paceibacterota bacterium]|nr:O-acetyl-ADP-ribose deacetylase [Verrucomicrobiota bacterium]HRY47793.1 O-acetyl-ADP-ribose deacetylase [Candidatus Paceibacterota bacterium]
MHPTSLDKRIELQLGDITQLSVDAIVNAANRTLLGGGGVDGAIHRAAGPGLLEECRRLQGCEIGAAKITGGHAMAARWVIHTVGPVWKGGSRNEPELLARCYRSCFALAKQHQMSSIAFPAISTGAYGYPPEPAARIALLETRKHLAHNTTLKRVIFICFDAAMLSCYRAAAGIGTENKP